MRLAAAGELADAVVLADAVLLRQRADRLGLQALRIERCLPSGFSASDASPGSLRVWHHPLALPALPGQPDPRNAASVLSCLDDACDACRDGIAAALVTGPVQKSTIAASGVEFTGHTEYLAQRLGVPLVVMMLVGGGLRVALATTHLPLAEVPAAITPALLDQVLAILCQDLRRRFAIAHPRVLVCGLNPHAGESGHLGREEIEVIAPALERARARGEDVHGPLPADTLFTPAALAGADAVLAMYHDQGLPVLKMKSFGGGVNVTLGLPIVRTSVDHGTALDLAGSDRADPSSLREALALARQLVDDPAAFAASAASAAAGAAASLATASRQ